MTRLGALAASAALFTASAALAQAAGGPDAAPENRVHVDEFALPGEAVLHPLDPQQIGEAESAVVAPQPAPADRELTIPSPTHGADRPVAQIAESGQGNRAEASQQLTQRNTREIDPGSLSDEEDSRPVAIVRIDGVDRCDPEQAPERLEQCQRILETRAAEFDAAEPPELTAEQTLLAEQGEEMRLMARGETALGVRIATTDPDADTRSNQEIASLYLAPQEAPRASGQPDPVEPGLEDALVEVLQGLGAQLPPGGLPSD